MLMFDVVFLFFCFLFVSEKDHDLDLCSYSPGYYYHHNCGSGGDQQMIPSTHSFPLQLVH